MNKIKIKIKIKIKNARWLLLSGVVVAIDQLSKWFAVNHLVFQQPYRLTSFFNLTLNFNAGAAFSFLGNAGGWQVYLFQAISAVITVFLGVWLLQLKTSKKLQALALSLLIGGAIGNLIDRVRLTYVVDFFDFHIKGWHYATFNVADSAVCVGAFFLILNLIWQRNSN